MSVPIRTVLIVDDDPQILRLVQKMLAARKVNVLVAPKPSDAIRICEREEVHLLISDVAMPEMDGNKLAERVLKLRPAAAVLLISGEFDEVEALEKRSGVHFLRKPFFPSELIHLLHEMLPDA